MPLIDFKTDLKSLRYGSDKPNGGSSTQPYIQSPIPGSYNSNLSNEAAAVFDSYYETNRTSLDFPIRGGRVVNEYGEEQEVEEFMEMSLELQEALTEIKNRTDVRCVVLTGNGKAFCAGQDLGEAIAADGPGLESILKDGYNPIIRMMRELPIPIVGAINGVAAGAGANIALACDLVVASENASFLQAFTKIGLIPDSGGTYFLPRIIGTQRAMAQMLLADKVTAAEA